MQLQSAIQKSSNSGGPVVLHAEPRHAHHPGHRPVSAGNPGRPLTSAITIREPDLALTVEGLSCPTSSTDRTQVDHPYRLALTACALNAHRPHRSLDQRPPAAAPRHVPAQPSGRYDETASAASSTNTRTVA